MMDEKILSLALKQEIELTSEDKDYLSSLKESDEEQIKSLITYNPNLIKYINMKDNDVDVSDEIGYNIYFEEIYEKTKDLDELKKININSKNEMVYEVLSQNEEVLKIIEPYAKQVDEEKIFKKISNVSNELINYMNDDTIIGLITLKVNIPSITTNKEKIMQLIEKDYPLIIDYVDSKLLSDDLIRKALEKDYIIGDDSPEMIRTNPEYIRYSIEHGRPRVINYIDEELLKENEYLIDIAIDNGYSPNFDDELFTNSPEIIRTNPKYVKRLIDKGYRRIIYYIPEEMLKANEDLIYLAIDKGYSIDNIDINVPLVRIIKTSPKYIKYAIEHGREEIIDNIPEEVLKENIDLIYLAIEKGYQVTYRKGLPTKLYLQNELKNNKSILSLIKDYDYTDSEVSKLFDDYETAYNYINFIEAREQHYYRDEVLNYTDGFSEAGYQNLISAIIEFGDLIFLKKLYETNKYKTIIDSQKDRFVRNFPNLFNDSTNIKDFLNLKNEEIVERINNEEINERIARCVASNMDYFGKEKLDQIMNNKKYREIFAVNLFEFSSPSAINVILPFLNDDEALKDKMIYKAIDLGYKISFYSDEYIKQYKFIKYSIENGYPYAIEGVEPHIISREQIKELFLLAREKNYIFDGNSRNIIDAIIDDDKIIEHVLSDEKSDDEARYILFFDEPLNRITKEQLDIYIKKILEKDKIELGSYLTMMTVPRLVENQELFNIVLSKKPIEQVDSLYSYGNNSIGLENKLSSEQLTCMQYYKKYFFLRDYFKSKTLEQVFNEYIKDETIWRIAFKEKNWELLDTDKLNKKELFSIKKYKQIQDEDVAHEFQLYIANNIDEIDENKIDQLGDVFNRLATTNSKSLFSIRRSLAEQLLILDNPVENFNKVEKIFIRNNIPLYAKMFFCFKTLYPNLTNRWGNMKFDDLSRMSPELKDSTLAKTNINAFMKNPTNNDVRFYVIYNDLLRNAVKSNSKDLRNYLDNIELGDYIYKKITGEEVINEKFERLSEKEQEEALKIYISHLETIYSNTKDGRNDKTDFSNYDLIKKIKYLKEKFKTTSKYDIKDRIVRSFGYSAGYTSFEQIRNEMKNTVKDANDRGIKYAQELEEQKFEFDDNDFLRCIGDYHALVGSIENGNFSKEFLTVFRETNDSDTTPLDIDFSLVRKKQSIYHSIEGTPTGFGFGNVFLVIKKDNTNINITRDENGNITQTKYDPKKLEMFGTKIEGTGGYETHWGVRTGLSLTDVDYILFKEERIIDYVKPYNEDGTINYTGEPLKHDDLSKIKFEIARHGYYIPVIDFTGKLIFSVDEYNNLKEKMNGLSYYENNEYKFSNNLEIDGMKEITPYLDKSNEVTEIKRNKIYDVITPILEEHNLKLKEKIDGDLTPGSVEIIDTGSTGRGTNKIGDGDFDLLLRIDQQLIRNSEKYNKFKNDIKSHIEQYPYESSIITSNGDYRFKGVQIDSNTTVDIDLSFTIKTDKISYSTDECLRDRLKTIEKQDKEKYKQVVSNIILAKQVLKRAGCYKPSRSDNNQGGLGGSGVENWILQYGGSFIDAAQDFINESDNTSFEEFKKKYFIWDFGENHFAERKGEYPHDNFVDNMNEIGYKKMIYVLKEFLKTNKFMDADSLKR